MSFIESVRRARDLLREEGRVSLRALGLEFALDDEQLEAVIAELVDVQQVAAREGKVVVWLGATLAASGAAPAPAARSAPEAERRQLTVMFCDLVDSTELSRRLGAEDLREAVQAYQETCGELIRRFEGHLAQYLGDGLLVYFGYPQAHEDDATRALHASLGCLAALPQLNEALAQQLPALRERPLRVRIAVHTGPVVVGEMGGGEKRESLAVGDTVNIAARLQEAAEPDSLVISSATERLVRGAFEIEQLGSRSLKGIPDPVSVHRVLRETSVRGRLDIEAQAGFTPLVGRDQELGMLLERWEQVGEGNGQVVLVSGEAGLGKSRLLQVFRERLGESPHGWLECRCSPYSQASPFHPLVELLEQGLGLTEKEEPDARLARLETGVAASGLPASEVVPLFAPLLSLPLPDRYAALQFSPELARKRTIEALVAWIFGRAESQPLVLCVEDLHWCDASTVEVLGWLLEQCPTRKVLTLMSFRPDFEPPWPARSHSTSLAVTRLSRRQATSLMVGMTHDVPLPAALIERVVERADGVPLFLEELTKSVVESDLVVERDGRRYELTRPITDLAIPATLQDSLMARLDRMAEGKEVAQLGAAVGRAFAYPLLRSVWAGEESRLRAGLAQLVDAEILYRRGEVPEAQFSFKHALIQETAYDSLLRSVRRRFHARIARALEDEFPESVHSQPEVVARHYDEAGLGEQAIAHYEHAAECARDRLAYEDAIRHQRRALELLSLLPADRERDEQELGLELALGGLLGTARGMAHADCEAAYQRAYQLAQQADPSSGLARALLGLAFSNFVKGDLAESGRLGEQALATAERGEEVADRVHARAILGQTIYHQGDFARASDHVEKSIRLDEAAGDTSLTVPGLEWDPCIMSRITRALCYWTLGRPERAGVLGREAVMLARRRNHAATEVLALALGSTVPAVRREYALTHEWAEEAVALAEKLGFPNALHLGTCVRGWATAHLGQVEQGIADMQQGLAGGEGRRGRGPGAGEFLGMYGEILGLAGRHDEGLGALGVGLALSEAKGEFRWSAELRRLRAETLLAQDEGAANEAEALLHEALEIARRQQAKGWELRTATSLARLWQRQGRQAADARNLLQPVYDSFTEGFATADLKDAEALLAELA